MAVTEKMTPAVQLARKLYKEYFARCFWHMKPDLIVTEEMIPVIVKGLRSHGGRDAFMAAAKLLELEGK